MHFVFHLVEKSDDRASSFVHLRQKLVSEFPSLSTPYLLNGHPLDPANRRISDNCLDRHGRVDIEPSACNRAVGEAPAKLNLFQTLDNFGGVLWLDAQDKVMPEKI